MGSVHVFLGWNPSAEESEIIKAKWPEGLELVQASALSPAALDEVLPRIEIAVAGISDQALAKAVNLKLFHTLGHGIDGAYKQRELLKARGVVVARANPASINIAEFILMSMIALSRRAFKMHEALAYQGSWSEARKAGRMKGSMGGELFGSSLGLIGYGDIGRETAKRAKAFGMEIGALVRRPDRLKDEADLSFAMESARIDEFLRRCDYVVLCAPLTDETRNLMDSSRFGCMKDGSYFINISRGPLVVEEALWEALRDGKLAGAASDVWCSEEKGAAAGYPMDRPIHHYNVIMTPHFCGATRQSRERAIINAGDNIRRYLAGQALVNVADLDNGY